MAGLRLALSWLTVLPVRAGTPSPAAAAAAIRWAPVVGALLGAAVGALLWGMVAVGVPALVAALLTIGALALSTRGMHLDGLADTADGLGCYGPPERALAVMRDGSAGPFAVVTLIVTVGAQAGALAALPPGPAMPAAAALACASGRASFAWACRRGVPAARPVGLGARVAATQPWWVAPVWWLALAAVGFPMLGWRSGAGVALAAAGVALLSWHTARRFGGVTGDVLGAASELATTAALVTLASA